MSMSLFALSLYDASLVGGLYYYFRDKSGMGACV